MLILVADLKTSSNEKIPNGQLMDLALEVVSKVIESPQNNDQSGDLTYDHSDISFPPVCAL
jgi:hypothetical protein